MENVPNLLLMEKGHFRDAILKHFARIGYPNTTFVKMSAADYGVPQARERVFFFGTRDDLAMPFDIRGYAEAVLTALRIRRPITVSEAIGDLPEAVVHSGHTMPYPPAAGLTPFTREMRLDGAGSLYTKAAKRQRGIGRGAVELHNHHTKEIQENRKALIALLAPGAKNRWTSAAVSIDEEEFVSLFLVQEELRYWQPDQQ